MITGEIRVGDRFIEAREVKVEFIGRNEIYYNTGGIHSASRTEAEFRSMFSRPVGWTRITPETLPGDDVEVVIATDGYHVESSHRSRRIGWTMLISGGVFHAYTHWRPVPPEFLPLPSPEAP